MARILFRQLRMVRGDGHISVLLYINHKALAFGQNGISSSFEGAADNPNCCRRRKERAEHRGMCDHFAAMTNTTNVVAIIRSVVAYLHRDARKVNGYHVRHYP